MADIKDVLKTGLTKPFELTASFHRARGRR